MLANFLPVYVSLLRGPRSFPQADYEPKSIHPNHLQFAESHSQFDVTLQASPSQVDIRDIHEIRDYRSFQPGSLRNQSGH